MRTIRQDIEELWPTVAVGVRYLRDRDSGMETCVRCGARFVVVERHPAVTNDQWCPACLPIVRAEAIAEVTA